MNPFLLNRKQFYKVSGIYKIICKQNGKIYIGSANNLYHRLQMHYNDLSKNFHKNIYLQRSYNKYGLENFIISIVELCKQDDLYNSEQKWINKEDCIIPKGFNINPTSVSNRGIKWRKESREKLSKSKKGIKHSDKHKRAIAKGHYKAIYCVEDNLNFESVDKASSYYNVNKSVISNYLHGRIKKLRINKTFIWKS